MIETFDYRRRLPELRDTLDAAFHRVLDSGRLILGPETEAFEREFAEYVDANHCVGVNSGTTAIHLALAALDIGPGDEVITVANTCAPTIAAIRMTGATPIFVDVRDHDLMMDVTQVESRLSARTRCILPVHLWGSCVDLDALEELSARVGIPIVEDCAQAHGTTWKGRQVGTVGIAGCFSFYPTKNIGAYGEAGAVITDDEEVAARLRCLRMYGYDGSPVSMEDGINGRISELQAAFLRAKLQVYPGWLERRREVAKIYDTEIENSGISSLSVPASCGHTYHQYVVRTSRRDVLTAALDARQIGWGIHYPVPVHRMPAYRSLSSAEVELPVTEVAAGEILSLPMHEGLAPDEVTAIVDVVNECDLD